MPLCQNFPPNDLYTTWSLRWLDIFVINRDQQHNLQFPTAKHMFELRDVTVQNATCG
jgi:hypothetical protein